MKRLLSALRRYGELVMFSHSIFSFSFLTLAALSARIASGGGPLVLPGLREGALLVLAFLGARSGANAFNRFADRAYDAANPRTAGRHIPAGSVSSREALVLTALSFALLAVAAAFLRPVCVALLPVAGALLLGYSLTKRFTWLCHGVLGVACACAPAGAWIALTGTLSFPALVLCAANAFWVAGFDIVYGIQDIDFDRGAGLHSIPERFGKARALDLSALCHLGAVGALALFGFLSGRGWAFFLGVGAIVALLGASAILCRFDYDRYKGFASYTVNKIVSLVLLAASVGELWL